MVSTAGALLSLHRGTCAREGAGSRQRHARVRIVRVRRIHRTRGSQVSGQSTVVIRTIFEKKKQQSRCQCVRVPVWQLWRALIFAGHCSQRLACCNWLHTWWWCSRPIRSPLLGQCSPAANVAVCSVKIHRQEGHPSQLAFAGPGCGAILCCAAGAWAAATANAPETAMPMLRLSRGAADQSKQHAWPGTECVARNSATSPSKDSPSVTASVANQSPGWANTSNLAPVPGPAFVRNAEREPKQSHPSNCRSLWPLQAPRCPARCGTRFTTTFFPQGVQMGTDVHFLGHRPAACAHRHTRSHRSRVLVHGATCTLSPDVAQVNPSFHRCAPSTQKPSTLAPTGVNPCTPRLAYSGTEASGFPLVLRGTHLGSAVMFRSFLRLPCAKTFLCFCFFFFNCVLLRPISLCVAVFFCVLDGDGAAASWSDGTGGHVPEATEDASAATAQPCPWFS